MSREKLAAVGAFVLVTLGLFAAGLFLVGERRLLFTTQIDLVTHFNRLNGLQPGAPVRVSGMGAGEVRRIDVPGEPGGAFVVHFTVREDLDTLVRTDSVTSIQTEGLVGGTYLAVAAGSRAAPAATPGTTLPSREPVDFAELLDQMSKTVALTTEAITDLRGDLEVAIHAVTDAAQRADAVVEEVGEDVAAITATGKRIAEDTAVIVADVRAGRGTVGRLFKEDDLYRQATDIVAEAERIVEEVRAAVAETRRTLAALNEREGPAQTLVADLRQTVAHAREALSNLEENTEALKRNWFFRGFFRRRGYFDLDDLSPAEYREGALARGNREALRIWLRGDLLFAPAPDGTPGISEGGSARLDSAMATFLRYPLQGPLIVEGHAASGSEAEAFVAARARAGTVREYLIRRFALDPQTVGVMPLVAPGDHGPEGERWDGVALAFFVERDVLREAAARRARPAERGGAAEGAGGGTGVPPEP